MYFLGPEAREPAMIKQLASQDSKIVPKVMILTYAGLETRAEFIQADRQIAEMLTAKLKAMAEENDDKIAFVPQRTVEEFKNTHPNWRSMDAGQLGKALAADYVIDLEINQLSLYEKGGHLMYRGRADISVSLIDVKHPDDTIGQQPYSLVYPTEARGGVPVDMDSNPMQFRQAFLGQVAQELSWRFSRYQKRDTFFVGGPS
jgi:hypothetical protein